MAEDRHMFLNWCKAEGLHPLGSDVMLVYDQWCLRRRHPQPGDELVALGNVMKYGERYDMVRRNFNDLVRRHK